MGPTQQAAADYYARQGRTQQQQQAYDTNAIRVHATKTAICQMWYNKMEITDMGQQTPDGPYMEV